MTFEVSIIGGEDGLFVAEALALPGCIAQGRTKEEALQNIQRAIENWFHIEQSRHQVDHDAEIVKVTL
jgi:predicted RNase H-like HicB family nuclease